MSIRFPEDFTRICEQLEQNDPETTLVSFHPSFLNHASFGDTQAKRLAKSLAHSTHVTELYLLVHSTLTVKGAACLMSYIISSPSLQILSLMGSLNTFFNPDQTMVVDVLVRAAVCNTNNLTLELSSIPLARSTLMMALAASSLLSEVHMANPSILVVDENNDPILEQVEFSTTIESVTVCRTNERLDDDDGYDSDEDFYYGDDNDGETEWVADWLFQCAVHLPRLKLLNLVDCGARIPFELLLSSRARVTLQQINYFINQQEEIEDSQGATIPITQQCEPFFNFLRETDSLDKVSIHLPNSVSAQSIAQALVAALSCNRSITSVSLCTSASSNTDSTLKVALQDYGARNKQFLERWEDLTIDIPNTIFSLAAATAVKTQRGRAALLHRLVLLLSS